MQNSARIELLQGDITQIAVDAIVNAANSALMGGGGGDGAIHRAGGPAILEACRKIGHCRTGEAVVTTAGNLPARFVIHTVGPVWNGGRQREPELLANCYRNSLLRAVENGCHSVAFPNISTGVYRFPKAAAAQIAVDTVRAFLAQDTQLEKVLLVCFDAENYRLVHAALQAGTSH